MRYLATPFANPLNAHRCAGPCGLVASREGCSVRVIGVGSRDGDVLTPARGRGRAVRGNAGGKPSGPQSLKRQRKRSSSGRDERGSRGCSEKQLPAARRKAPAGVSRRVPSGLSPSALARVPANAFIDALIATGGKSLD